jgi:hypothetical protein
MMFLLDNPGGANRASCPASGTQIVRPNPGGILQMASQEEGFDLPAILHGRPEH